MEKQHESMIGGSRPSHLATHTTDDRRRSRIHPWRAAVPHGFGPSKRAGDRANALVGGSVRWPINGGSGSDGLLDPVGRRPQLPRNLCGTELSQSGMVHRVVLNAVATFGSVPHFRWGAPNLSADHEEGGRRVAQKVHGPSSFGGARTVVERERDLSWCGPFHARCGERCGYDGKSADLCGLTTSRGLEHHRRRSTDPDHTDQRDRDGDRTGTKAESPNAQRSPPVRTLLIVV